MEIVLADRPLPGRIDEDDVGITSRQERPFLWVETKNLGRISAGHANELTERKTTFDDAFTK